VEEQKLNYRVVHAVKPDDFEVKLNALADAGYKEREVVMLPDFYRAVMRLNADPDLKGTVDMVRITLDSDQESTPLLAKMLAEGWVISSEYSKAVQIRKANSLQGKVIE